MTPRAAAWLAWSLFAVFLAAVAATLALVAFDGGSSDDLYAVPVVGFAIVGAVVATRERANPVGWLLLVTAVTFALGNLAYCYVRTPGHPGVVAVAWFADWTWIIWLSIAVILLPLLFPTGRPLTPRWRIVVGVVGVAVVLSIVGEGLRPGELDVETSPPTPIYNPLGVGGPWDDVVEVFAVLGAFLFVSGVVLAAVCLVLRLRRARGRERQQLKVFAVVVVAFLADALLFLTGLVAAETSAPKWVKDLNSLGWLVGLVLITVGLPTAIGVAILRHRLYDIDIVINRTLVYGTLTVALAAAYLVSVLLLRLVLSPATGHSDLAVAASTLAVAALFRPLRNRIQRVVDRRFFRSRYDAVRTLDSFTGRLRDELDVDALGVDLRRVVDETMQPAHVSLWLKSSR
jgi:hypothetical protein